MGVKRKGTYQYESLGWHQNHSSLVIPMAVEHEILQRGTASEFIKNHKNIYDFMLRAKVPRNSKLVLRYDDGTEVPQQNICRYYASESGGKLVKLMPHSKAGQAVLDKQGNETGEVYPQWKELSLDKNWNVKICNNMVDFGNDIDYNYYISEAEKLLKPVKDDNFSSDSNSVESDNIEVES